MADADAALVEKVCRFPQRPREADMHDYAWLEDLGRSLEVAKWVLGHFARLNARKCDLNAGSPSNARFLGGERETC